MKAAKWLALSALTLPVVVFANEGAHIDGYYIPYSGYHTSDGGDSVTLTGEGGGGKAMIPIGPWQNVFFTGEYQATSQDKSVNGVKLKSDIDQFRIGAGYQVPLATGTGAIYAEYINVEEKAHTEPSSDIDYKTTPDGFGVHARLAFPIAQAVNVYGQIGYVSLSGDDTDYYGPEFLVGASVDFAPNFGAFVDYRQTNFDVDFNDGGSNEHDKIRDLRVGIRFLFDTGGDYRQRGRYGRYGG